MNSSSRALTVQGRIAGLSGGGGFEGFSSQPFTAGAKLTSAEAGGKSCGELTLKIHTIHLTIRGGLAITLDPIKLDVTDLSGDAKRLGAQLCLLADGLAGEGSNSEPGEAGQAGQPHPRQRRDRHPACRVSRPTGSSPRPLVRTPRAWTAGEIRRATAGGPGFSRPFRAYRGRAG